MSSLSSWCRLLVGGWAQRHIHVRIPFTGCSYNRLSHQPADHQLSESLLLQKQQPCACPACAPGNSRLMNASVKSSSTAGDFEASCPHKCSIYTTEVEPGTWKWVKHKEVVHSNNRCWNGTIDDRVPIGHLFTIRIMFEMRHVDEQLPFWQHYCSKLKNQSKPTSHTIISIMMQHSPPSISTIALCFLHLSSWVQCPYPYHRYITFIVKKPRPQEKILLRRDVSPAISDTVSRPKPQTHIQTG